MKLIFPVLCQEVFNCEQARVTTTINLPAPCSSAGARTHSKANGWKCEGSVPETKVRKENSCLLYDDEKGSLIYAENSILGKVIVAAVTVCMRRHRPSDLATLISLLFLAPRLSLPYLDEERQNVSRGSQIEAL